MDLRTVLLFLIAQTACETYHIAINRTIPLVQKTIKDALDEYSKLKVEDGLTPDLTCTSLNSTELQQLCTTSSCLSSSCCFLKRMAEEIPRQLSEKLLRIAQYIKDMDKLMGRQAACQNCSLSFENDMHKYVFIKCLLNLLDHRLRTNTCWVQTESCVY